jgi:hypothetical protein
MFGKKKTKLEPYDRTTKRPVIHASICNGEQVAGFQNLATGKFTEVMLIRDAKDLSDFCKTYGVEKSDITKEY